MKKPDTAPSFPTTDGVPRLLSGIKPGMEIHLGHYFGGIKDVAELQATHRCHLLIADYHAITRPDLVDQIEERSIEIAAAYLASGIDGSNCTIYRQSDVPEVFEIFWLLTAITPMGRLDRCPVYKEYRRHGSPADAGIFMYPVLMSADIILARANRVLVGQDQTSHIELARDLIKKLNHTLQRPLAVCEAHLSRNSMVLGTDGEKMSRRYKNTIPLLATSDELSARIRGIKTDSRQLHEPGDPAGTVLSLHELVASGAQHREMQQKLNVDGNWGDAKTLLIERLEEFLKPIQSRYNEFRKDDDSIRDALRQGAQQVRDGALPILEELRRGIGIGRKLQVPSEQ